MKKFFVLILISAIFLVSCSVKKDKEIKISVTNWIGYTPILYAHEKSWLKELNIKTLIVGSLSENLYLYKAKNCDVFVGTQYEYHIAKDEHKDLIPIMLFDKSNGGDVVISNYTIEELEKADEIDAYLEIDSVNSILLKSFIKKHNLKDKKINYHNKEQLSISALKINEMKKPTLIISYAPYYQILEKNGLKKISTTRDNDDLLIIDGLYINKELFEKNKKTFLRLKMLIDKSINILQNHPKEYFDTISKYIPQTSYEEFLNMSNDIIWLNKKTSKTILKNLENENFNTKELLL